MTPGDGVAGGAEFFAAAGRELGLFRRLRTAGYFLYGQKVTKEPPGAPGREKLLLRAAAQSFYAAPPGPPVTRDGSALLRS